MPRQVRHPRHHVFRDQPGQHLDRTPAATAKPTTLPIATSTRPSVKNCAASRTGEAPSAPRTAISRLRLSERTNSKLDTFTHAISSSNPAPPSSASRIGRMSPTNGSDSEITLAPWPRFESGYCLSSCFAIALAIRLRRLDRHSVFQPRNTIQAVATAPHVARIIGMQRRPRSLHSLAAKNEISAAARRSSSSAPRSTRPSRRSHFFVRQTASATPNNSACTVLARSACLRLYRSHGPAWASPPASERIHRSPAPPAPAPFPSACAADSPSRYIRPVNAKTLFMRFQSR